MMTSLVQTKTEVRDVELNIKNHYGIPDEKSEQGNLNTSDSPRVFVVPYLPPFGVKSSITFLI